MNNSQNFTKEFLDNISIPEKGKRLVIYDTNRPELAVRVTDKGTKTFIVIKKHKGESLKVTIGHSPIMTISQPRKQTFIELAKLADGINPNDEKKKIREETTLKELFKEYMGRYSKKSKKSWEYDEREITRFLSSWFRRKISDISSKPTT